MQMLKLTSLIYLLFLSVRELHDNDLELIGPKVFYNIPELLHLWVQFILLRLKHVYVKQ